MLRLVSPIHENHGQRKFLRFGMEKRLAAATGLPVRVANDPAHATIEGCGVVIGELNYISKHRKK